MMKEVKIDINLEQDSDMFVTNLMLCTKFPSFVFNFGDMTYSEDFVIKRNLNKGELGDWEKNYLSGELISKAEKLFMEFLLKEYVPTEITLAEYNKMDDNKTYWKLPGDIFASSDKSTTILAEGTKKVVGNDIILNITLGFDKNWLDETKAIKVFTVVE